MTIVKEKHAKSTQFDHLSPQERKEQLRIHEGSVKKNSVRYHYILVLLIYFTLHVYTTK